MAGNAHSISRLTNVNPGFDTKQKQILIKNARAEHGQVKVLADKTVNASTTLVTDTELTFNVQKGRTYHVQAKLLFSTGATPGLKLQLTAPACTTSATTFVGKAEAKQGTANVAGVTLDYSKLNASLYSSAVAYSSVSVDAIWVPEADDTLTIQFAQNTSDASDTSLLRGSYLKCTEVTNTGAAPTSV